MKVKCLPSKYGINSLQRARKMTKPLKRHPALIPLSKDHHFGLLLCWKIRTGIKREIEPERISKYVIYFYQDHLATHFEEEEEHIFTLLDENDEDRKKAESQHRKIRRLVKKLSSEPEKIKLRLGQIEEEVEGHIRFEERKLFPYIQSILDEPELERLRVKIEEIHEARPEEWTDQFWEK